MTRRLQRITTEYSETEDRIRLSGEMEDDAPVVIWLSQRLLRRLVPILLRWLEARIGDMPYPEIMQGFALQAAKNELAPQPPVRTVAGSAAWLAQSVDIVHSEEAVSLTFCRMADGQEAVSLTLAATPLRQWLSIVHDAYLKAEWTTEAWPLWLRENSQPAHGQALLQ